jgi:RNA-directed DNA polymerase
MKVSEMQRKLSLWAEQDKERKFYDLYSILVNQEWLRIAHDNVRQNRGSVTAGVDGITMQDFDKALEQNLQRLNKDLKAENFEPFPVRRVVLCKMTQTSAAK